MIVSIDPDALELPAADLTRLCAQRLDGTSGVGQLVSGYLSTLASIGGSLDPVDALHLSSATADLLSVMLGGRLRMLSKLSPERRDRERFIRIRHFIRTNLGDPALAPDTIAAAHHISLRTLHRLFQAHAGTTVSTWIRERRLEGYRTDLLDPALAAWSVYRIAIKWGFTDASHASRVFKAAYGLSPAVYRAVRAAVSGR
jgi:AraC-like DNA-binding protein